MTGGGGLVVCFFSLMLAVVSSKPQECIRGREWTINGENILEHTIGNVTVVALLPITSHFGQQQALRMEILHQDLRDYGMTDLSFIIVNSKETKSDDFLTNLRGIISFPVYQETDEDEVWTLMDGNDGDMFVYDRCGRLTYYIPHPLSNLQDKHPVVRAAILSTYFRSPCGAVCPTNEVIDFMDEELDNGQQTSFNNNNLTDEEVHYPNGTGVLLDVEDDFPLLNNETASDEYEGIDDYDYKMPYYDDVTNNSMADDTSTIPSSIHGFNISTTTPLPTQKSLLSSFFKFVWGDGKSNENSAEKVTATSKLTNDIQIDPIIDGYTTNSTNPEVSPTSVSDLSIRNKKIDDCDGIDENVCIDWSKGKMIHAQRCCTIALRGNADRHGKGCKNFGKKRCKKIQPLLKCCLKTEIMTSEDKQVKDKAI